MVIELLVLVREMLFKNANYIPFIADSRSHTSLIDYLLKWPYVSITSILIIFGLMLIVALPASLLIDEEKLKAYEEEIKRWEEARKQAILKRDRKAYLKIMRRESRIKRLREEISKARLKASTISMFMWILVMSFIFSKLNITEVVYFPLLGTKLDLVGWYIVLSFWLYSPCTKILKMFSKNIRSLIRRFSW